MFLHAREKERVEEEEPEIEERISGPLFRGRMINIDKDIDIKFKKCIERNKREANMR